MNSSSVLRVGVQETCLKIRPVHGYRSRTFSSTLIRRATSYTADGLVASTPHFRRRALRSRSTRAEATPLETPSAKANSLRVMVAKASSPVQLHGFAILIFSYVISYDGTMAGSITSMLRKRLKPNKALDAQPGQASWSLPDFTVAGNML